MKLRKRRGDREVSLDEPLGLGEEEVKREIAVWEDNPEQRYSREEMQEILNEAVDGLKEDFRTVFVLRDIEELSTEETAEAVENLDSGGEKQAASSPVGTAREVDP